MLYARAGLLIPFLFISDLVLSDSTVDEALYSLPTIIISPQWRDIDLQQEPSTVEALTGRQLDAADVRSTQDLQYEVPGLVFRSSAGIGDPYLRGVGGTVSASGSSGVSTFIDGIYLISVSQALQQLYDIDRIEVLKGPRGVHLGRNVVGGAISLHTQDPEPYRSANADVSYGTKNQRQIRSMINLPIDDTGLSFRLAGVVNKRDGYSRNVLRNEDLDDQNDYAARGKLRYRHSSELDLVLSVMRSRQDDSRDFGAHLNSNIGTNGGILFGGVVPDEPRETTSNFESNQDITQDLYSTNVNWKTKTLEAQSITAYQKTQTDLAIDLDGTNVDFSTNLQAFDKQAISQEFRLGSAQGQRLTWVTGLYYLHEDGTQSLDVELPLSAIENKAESDTKNTSYAAFGEISLGFADRWRASLGLRYSYDDSQLDLTQTFSDPFGVLGPAGTFPQTIKRKEHWDAVTPELGITYAHNADSMYYINVSRGFKSGGYNAYSVQPSYDAEYMWAYEVGLKTTLPNEHLRVNAALFHYDYTDIQLLTLPPGSPLGTFPIVTNAAEATVQGLDLQVWLQPIANLEFSGGTTLLDASFDEFVSVDPNNLADDPDRSGDTLPQAPKVSLVLGAKYRWVLPNTGDIRLSADYRYQSAVYFNPYKDQAVRQDAYSLINASLGFYTRNNRWYAELYGNNLTDELYSQNIIRIDPGVGTKRFWGAPRTFGARIGYSI